MKKFGIVFLDSWVNYDGVVFVFFLDFFEKIMCIIVDVKLGGDIFLNNDLDGVKLCL